MSFPKPHTSLPDKLDYLTEQFAEAALTELKTAPSLSLVAKANRLDNFITWAAGYIRNGMAGLVDIHNSKHCTWWNALHEHEPQYTTRGGLPVLRWDRHPLVRAIAEKVWNEFR